MKIPVHIQTGRHQGSVRAFCPDLPGCSASASTDVDALTLLRERIAEYFDRGSSEALPPGTRRALIEI